jgi:hypothetical protein
VGILYSWRRRAEVCEGKKISIGRLVVIVMLYPL